MSSLLHRRITSILVGLAVTAIVLASPLIGTSAQPVSAQAPGFTAAAPVRVMDTRTGVNGATLGPGHSRHIALPSHIPAGVKAVAVNLTALNASDTTYLTVWPRGSVRPGTSSLNIARGEVRANAAIVHVGRNRAITVFNGHGSVDVLVDITGWFHHGFVAVAPTRIVDTRDAGAHALGEAATLHVRVPRTLGIPGDAAAVVVNVTATNATRDSYVTVMPSGGSRPRSSTLNVTPGVTAANLSVLRPGTDGRIIVYNDAGHTDVMLDVVGWFRAGTLEVSPPVRLFDTRSDRCHLRLETNATRTVNVTDRSDVGGAVLNVTAIATGGNTFVTVWPTGQPRPTTSNLNVSGRHTVANAVVVGLGAGGHVNMYNGGAPVDVIVDVLGLFPGTTRPGGAVTCPSQAANDRPSAPVASTPTPARTLREQLVVGAEALGFVGVDRVAVWVCDVPRRSAHPDYAATSQRVTIDPASVAAWANREVAPYFRTVSGGRYTASFEAGGRVRLSSDAGAGNCYDEAIKRTGAPFTNVLATDTYGGLRGLGFAGPGGVYADPAHNPALLATAPSASLRGLYASPDTLGGHVQSTPVASLVAHELGHTLAWPHSHTGGGNEYDNRLDMMSGYGWREPLPQHTLAFNRLAAGWISDAEVRVHRQGTTSVTLSAPLTGGTQLLVVPAAADTRRLLTLEARPAHGADHGQPVSGVAVHVVDQTPGVCAFRVERIGCYGISRRQAQAWGAPESTDHVLEVGDSVTVDGVTMTVARGDQNAFDVVLSGTYRPAQMPMR